MKSNDGVLPAASPAPQESVGKGVRRIVAAARKLRRTSTDVERKLWHRIRDKQIDNFRFRRQRPIGKYIVDFICLDAKLIVELDGGQHAEYVAYDDKRTAFLGSLGYRVLRFSNNEVIENIDGVLERLGDELLVANANPTLALPLTGEGIDRASDDGSTIANAPSPAQRGKVGMGAPRKKVTTTNAEKGKAK